MAKTAAHSLSSGIGREVQTFAYHPGKRTYRIVLIIKNQSGALSRVLRDLASSGINLTSISGSNDLEADAAVIGIFAETMKKRKAPEEIQKTLSASPFVIDVRVEGTDDGILIEKDLFPLRFGAGRRAIVTSQQTFSEMMKAIRDAFGSGGDTIVYEQGVAAGRANAKELVNLMGKDKALENQASFFHLYTAYGLAKPVSVMRQTSPLKANLQFESSFECVGQKSAKPYSQFLRGVIVGATEELFGVKAVCHETKCIASGDPYCEFEVAPK